MPVVLVVATIDDPAVLVGAMPDLGSEEAAAFAAFDFPGENAHAAVSASLPLAPRCLRLHHLEGDRVDDGGMALLHEVAGDLPRVLHHLLREEVQCEGLFDTNNDAPLYSINDAPLYSINDASPCPPCLSLREYSSEAARDT